MGSPHVCGPRIHLKPVLPSSAASCPHCGKSVDGRPNSASAFLGPEEGEANMFALKVFLNFVKKANLYLASDKIYEGVQRGAQTYTHNTWCVFFPRLHLPALFSRVRANNAANFKSERS